MNGGTPDNSMMHFGAQSATNSTFNNDISLPRSPAQQDYSTDADFERSLFELENLLKFEFGQDTQRLESGMNSDGHLGINTGNPSNRVDENGDNGQDLLGSSLAVT